MEHVQALDFIITVKVVTSTYSSLKGLLSTKLQSFAHDVFIYTVLKAAVNKVAYELSLALK